MTRVGCWRCLGALLCFGLVFAAQGAHAQSADLRLQVTVEPDMPLFEGRSADLVFTVENRGPNFSGPIEIRSTYFPRIDGHRERILFRLNPAETAPCPFILRLSDGDPVPGGAPYAQARVRVDNGIEASQSYTCRLRIEVAIPLQRTTRLGFSVLSQPGGASDPDFSNNVVTFGIGSAEPAAIPVGTPWALGWLGLLVVLVGGQALHRSPRG